MNQLSREIYFKLREKYSPLKNKNLKCKEPSVQYKINENILNDLWYKSGYDRHNLITLCGQKIIIVSPGEHNPGQGPDFINAEIIIGDKKFRGDIEIDVNRSDWFKHHHYENPLYKNVILHIFYDNDTDIQPKKNFYELCIKDKISPEFLNIIDDMGMVEFKIKNEPLCSISQTKDYEFLEQLLFSSAEVRLWLKSEQFFTWFENQKKQEQMLYERICESFGYGNNKDNFLLLSKLISISKLRNIVKSFPVGQQKFVIETLYFGIGGFLNENKIEDLPEYFINLRSLWEEKLKRYFTKTIDKSRWRYYKTRPVNYPQRRIAALSRFVSQFIDISIPKVLSGIMKLNDNAEIILHLKNIIFQPAEGFFATRCSFTSKEHKLKYPLFGEEKVITLIVNVIFPFLVYKCRQEKDEILYKKVLDVYKMLKGSEKNRIVSEFIKKIIKYTEYQKYFQLKTIFSQGLIQLYKDFCEPNKGICTFCKLPEILRYKPLYEDTEFNFVQL